MAICNIFKSLKKERGTFLMFSQYTEDITNSISDGYNHRVVPSKFIALNGCYEEYDNETIADYLTKYFENGCAVCRSAEKSNIQDISKSIFWQALDNSGILYKNGEKDQKYTIKYIGDINIHSFNKYDGVGYYELYLHMSNNIKPLDYILKYDINDSIESKDHLEGYDIEINPVINYSLNGESNFEPITTNSYDSYDVNTIILLYDVYVGDVKKYENIPMGIYFTGPIDNGSMKYGVTMYVSNSDIYGGSTSYALKICSKLVTGPDNLNINEVDVESGYNSDMIKLLEQMAITHEKMDAILNKTYTCSQNYKDLYAIFKNSQTNVPYIKNVNGVDYWYVNGKRLSPATIYVTPEQNPTNNLTLNTSWADGDVMSYESVPSILKLNWQVLNNNVVVSPSGFYVNGEKIYEPKNPYEYNLSNINPSVNSTSLRVNIAAQYEGKEVSKDNYVKFSWPSYCFTSNEFNPDIMPLIEGEYNINSSSVPGKVLVGGKVYKFNYTNTDEEFVFYMYPKEFGLLEYIIDKTGYDYINDFECYEKLIKYGDVVVPYYIYKDKDYANVKNFNLEFK